MGWFWVRFGDMMKTVGDCASDINYEIVYLNLVEVYHAVYDLRVGVADYAVVLVGV